MREKSTPSEKAMDGLIGARTREALRQVDFRFQHLLIGAVTKRPQA